MDSVYRDLTRNLSKARYDRHYTQSQIARALNIPQPTYANYETGVRKMPISILKMIADLLQVSIDDLVSEEEIDRP
jgi:transcriptional regulator with XRE-family HTH domain